MNFNIIKLETFYWVVRLGSFSKAAAHLHTTPPSVTTRIQQLEEELEVQLFDRSGRERTPTAKGLEVFGKVEQILLSLTDLECIARANARERIRLRIGVVELVAMTWLPTVIAYLREHVREFEIEVSVDLAIELIGSLEAGELDAVVAPFTSTRPQCRSRSVGFVRYGWFALAGMLGRATSLESISDWPVARLVGSFPCEQTLQKHFPLERSPRVIACNHLMAIRTMVVSGIAVGVLPELLIRDAIDLGTVDELPMQPEFPETEMHVSWAVNVFPDSIADFVSNIGRLSTFGAGRAPTATRAPTTDV